MLILDELNTPRACRGRRLALSAEGKFLKNFYLESPIALLFRTTQKKKLDEFFCVRTH